MIALGFLLLTILVKPRNIAMFPEVEFDFSEREYILCEAVLDQRIVEGIGKGLDPELEGPEFR
jgi:hypothetical protein